MSNAKRYNTLAIIGGSWFLLTSWIWGYGACLIISYPFGLLGMYFWYKGRKIDPTNPANKVALTLHIAGFGISMAVLIMLLLNN
jgi:hypothetical protein